MPGWEINADDNGNPILPTASVLSKRRLKLSEGLDVNHPVRAIVGGAGAFARAYEEAVSAVAAWRAAGATAENAALKAKSAFESMCYRAAEYLEAYQKLPKAIAALSDGEPKKEFKAFLQKVFQPCSRDWFLVCNRIKHNQNVLASTVFSFPALFDTMEVITLLRPIGADRLGINEDFHKGGARSVPFAIAMRQILHDIIRIDRAAAKLLASLPEDDTADPMPEISGSLIVGRAVQTVQSWPLWVSLDGSSMVDTFEISGRLWKSVRIPATKRREAATVRLTLLGDGITRQFPII